MKKKNPIWSFWGIPEPEIVQQAIATLIQIGLRTLNADEGSLLLYRKRENELEFVCTQGLNRTPPNLTGKTVPMGKGFTGMAALTREIQTSSRAISDGFYHVEDDGSPNTVLAAPMLVDDDLIGVLTAVSFDTEKIFTSEDCHTFGLLALVGGLLIEQQQELTAIQTGTVPQTLSEQKATELKIAKLAVELVQKKPENAEKAIKILELLKEF